MNGAYYHSPELPWSPSPEEERRFRIITAAALLGFIVISAVVALLHIPPADRYEAESSSPLM